MQLEQSKAWWEEQAANKAALRAAQHEAEQAFAELTRYQVQGHEQGIGCRFIICFVGLSSVAALLICVPNLSVV